MRVEGFDGSRLRVEGSRGGGDCTCQIMTLRTWPPISTSSYLAPPAASRLQSGGRSTWKQAAAHVDALASALHCTHTGWRTHLRLRGEEADPRHVSTPVNLTFSKLPSVPHAHHTVAAIIISTCHHSTPPHTTTGGMLFQCKKQARFESLHGQHPEFTYWSRHAATTSLPSTLRPLLSAPSTFNTRS